MSSSFATGASVTLSFGPFRLIPQRGVLLEGDKPCRIGSRAIEILTALVERAGETVTKQDLLARAWPNTFVDDANLRVHVGALRKMLGDGQAGARYIVNVMGRGYCFVAPVRRVDDDPVPQPVPSQQISRQHNLPAPLTRVLGRGNAVEAIALQVPMRRCVTITGPGGIGKTTVAVAVAEKLLPVYDDGVWFVDLATVTDRQGIPFALASVLGFSLSSANTIASLMTFLQDRRMLLLLDNCEHVVDSVAPLAENILRYAPNVHILATSREALRAAGEWVYRLKSIETPPRVDTLTAEQALEFPAVQLFVERASASLDGFALTDADAPIVAEVCRRLDGLPLAIELVAVRIDMFGLHGLATVLDDHFLLMSEGQRTALPRQQSLLGTLDWSYRLLSPVEQTILRRLSVFRGDFTLDAAIAVAGGDGISVEQVYAGMLTLSTKSLVATDVTSEAPHHQHRLLHVTRAFVSHKLRESGESGRIDRLHAEYLCRLLTQAEADWDVILRAPWLGIYARCIDDVRSALDWAFSPDGDAAIGVALTAAALPLGFQLSLIDEFRTRVERALLHVGRLTVPQTLAEMRLNIALGSLMQQVSPLANWRNVGFDRAIELSQRLDRPVHQVEPLIVLAISQLAAGDYGPATETADKARSIALASDDPMALLGADRVSAQVRHFAGDHATARELATAVLNHPAMHIPLAYNLLATARTVSMRIILARILWMQGFPEQAVRVADEALGFAKSNGAFSLCQTLVVAAIPIAIWNGDHATAGGFTTKLIEQADRFSLGYWLSWGTAFQKLLRTLSEGDDAPPQLSGPLQLDTFATFSVDFLTLGTARRADDGLCGWCSPEIFRARGEWLLAQGAPGAAESAEALFQHALDTARQQGALSWELRAAMSLTRLWRRRDHSMNRERLLSGVLQRFTEGHATADLREATALLEDSNDSATAVRPVARSRTPALRRQRL